MSLTYSYYFIKKDKIYIAFQHIQNQLFKINLYLWKDIIHLDFNRRNEQKRRGKL